MDETKVEFGFELGDLVKVKSLGCRGVIQMQDIDRNGVLYYVRTVTHAGWFYEDQIGGVKEDG